MTNCERNKHKQELYEFIKNNGKVPTFKISEFLSSRVSIKEQFELIDELNKNGYIKKIIVPLSLKNDSSIFYEATEKVFVIRK